MVSKFDGSSMDGKMCTNMYINEKCHNKQIVQFYMQYIMKIAFKMYIAIYVVRVIYVVSKVCMKIHFYFHADFFKKRKLQSEAGKDLTKHKLEKFKDIQIDNFIHPSLICTWNLSFAYKFKELSKYLE